MKGINFTREDEKRAGKCRQFFVCSDETKIIVLGQMRSSMLCVVQARTATATAYYWQSNMEVGVHSYWGERTFMEDTMKTRLQKQTLNETVTHRALV